MCKHQFVDFGYCLTCSKCGVTNPILHIDTYNVFSAPINRGYSRTLRFKTKVDKILLCTPQPKITDPVWSYLRNYEIMLSTPLCVRVALKQSKLINKHYDNIKLFCDIFTDFKIDTKHVHQTHNYMTKCFDIIHSAWNFSLQPTFFSYTWIVRYLLEQIKSPFMIYLKNPTSSKRHEKYKMMFDNLISPGMCDEMWNRAILNTHSRSA